MTRLNAETHEREPGEEKPDCIGQWCCGCDEHPIGKPWGWNYRAWEEHHDAGCKRSSSTTGRQDGD